MNSHMRLYQNQISLNIFLSIFEAYKIYVVTDWLTDCMTGVGKEEWHLLRIFVDDLSIFLFWKAIRNP